MKKQSK